MTTINVYIRWLARKGWIFTVYEFDHKVGQGTNTAQSSDTGLVSDLVPGLDAGLAELGDDSRTAIQAAIEARYPDATVEFGPAPVNRA